MLGCVAATTFVPDATAKLGPWESGLSECAAVTVWSHSGRSVNRGEPIVDTVAIPPGWTIVGGTSAGAGAKHFGTTAVWRAGQSYVGPAPGDPLETEMHIYYRDSFFLLLRGDESKVSQRNRIVIA